MSVPDTQLRVLVVSDRAAVRSFFASLPFAVTAVGAWETEVGAHAGRRVDVVLVDVGAEPGAAERLCAEVHTLFPDAALLGVVCCERAVGLRHLHTLLGDGLSGIIDLHATPEEATRALVGAAHGAAVVQLRLGREQRSFLRDVLVRGDTRSETNLHLLTLVCRGLPDHEIGRRLHLSPHTVKHYVEQLREEIGVRNRIELASWAGRAGLYNADGE